MMNATQRITRCDWGDCESLGRTTPPTDPENGPHWSDLDFEPRYCDYHNDELSLINATDHMIRLELGLSPWGDD